jgi:thiamine-monophosphate kinase
VYVSGTLGDARLALEALRGTVTLSPDMLAQARTRLEQPTPRVALGQALRGIASAAIDVSDGLQGDLQHILRASGVGASIDTSIAIKLIASSVSNAWAPATISFEQQLEFALAGGDDYELAFTAPVSAREAVQAAADQAETPVTRIGRIDAAPGLRLLDAAGAPWNAATPLSITSPEGARRRVHQGPRVKRLAQRPTADQNSVGARARKCRASAMAAAARRFSSEAV